MKKIVKLGLIALVVVMSLMAFTGCNGGVELSSAETYESYLESTNNYLSKDDTNFTIKVTSSSDNDGTKGSVSYTFKKQGVNWHIKGSTSGSGVTGSSSSTVDLYYDGTNEVYIGKNTDNKWASYENIYNSAEFYVEYLRTIPLPNFNFDDCRYSGGYYNYETQYYAYKFAFNDGKVTYVETNYNASLNDKVFETKMVVKYSYDASVTLPTV